MVFKREKNDTSNQKPIRSHRGVRVSRQNSRLSLQLAGPLRSTFNEKSLTQRVFLAKKVKNISEMEWNSFVCFTVDKENGREPAKQHQKGINKTHQDWHAFYKYKNHSGSNGSFFRNRFRKISFSCLQYVLNRFGIAGTAKLQIMRPINTIASRLKERIRGTILNQGL